MRIEFRCDFYNPFRLLGEQSCGEFFCLVIGLLDFRFVFDQRVLGPLLVSFFDLMQLCHIKESSVRTGSGFLKNSAKERLLDLLQRKYLLSRLWIQLLGRNMCVQI